MIKSQGINEEINENNDNNLSNIKFPPIKIPVAVIIIIIAAIFLAINYFFLPPEKSIGGKLPKNEYIHHMSDPKPQPKKDVITPEASVEGNPAPNEAQNAEIKINKEGL